MKLKLLIGGIGLVVLFVYGFKSYFFIDKKHITHDSSVRSNNLDSMHKAVSHSSIDSLLKKEPVDSNIVISNQESSINENEMMDVDDYENALEWQYERGYPRYDEHGNIYTNGYEEYEDATLQELAKNGDARAAVMLGQKAYLENQDYELAKRHFVDAIIGGNTYAIAEMINLNMAASKAFSNIGDDLNQRKHYEEAYLWSEVGLLRGDRALMVSQKTYKFDFSDEELKVMKIRAQDYLKDLENMRIESGQGAFDNSYPEEIDKIYKKIIEAM